MSELVFHEYGGVDIENAVVIVGFPSLGLVSSIATGFIAKELKMDMMQRKLEEIILVISFL